MAKLNDKHRTFIISNLACYKQPAEIIALVKEEFGIEISYQQIRIYNPDSIGSHQLAKKWKDLHEKIRNDFIEQIEIEPIATSAYRLRELRELYLKHKQNRNYIAAQSVLEQAAKEQGGMYLKEKKIEDPQALTPQQIMNQQFNQINQYFGMANIEDVSDPYDMDQVLLKKPNVKKK